MSINKVTIEEFAKQYEAHPLPVVLYGAGQVGKKVLRRLRERNIIPLCFCTTATKVSIVEGIRVVSLQQIEALGLQCYMIITVAQATVDEIAGVLEEHSFKENIYYIKSRNHMVSIEVIGEWLKSNGT